MISSKKKENSIVCNLRQYLSESMRNATKVDIICSFIITKGVLCLEKILGELEKRNVPIRILTTDYINITEPDALEILDKYENIKLKMCNEGHFHQKAYIIYGPEDEIFVGSSNISKPALTGPGEWNYRLSRKNNPDDFDVFVNEFENLFSDVNSIEVNQEIIDEYKVKRKPPIIKKGSRLGGKFDPNEVQEDALKRLEQTRTDGAKRALVVAATGTGKTYLAALDTQNGFERILFVAHTKDILDQAKKSFETIRKNDKATYYIAESRDFSGDMVFAMNKTLNNHCEEIPKDYFDYIVIDEFHHSVAKTYRKIIDYFEPKFLLGLSATPERMDCKDVFAICNYNVAYEIYLREAIEKDFLSKFVYYGITDTVDYDTIKYVNGKYDEDELNVKLINDERNALILKHYLKYRKKRAIAFCANVKHAESVAKYFSEHLTDGTECAVVTHEETEHWMRRDEAMKKLDSGELNVVFTVNMFNEGVDVPAVDMIMFLRPTESFTVFTQQLGRGLRKCEGKEFLTVLDFIGNYRNANMLPYVLSGTGTKKGMPTTMEPPKGCIVDFDFGVIDIFKKLEEKQLTKKNLIDNEYHRIKEELGHVPSRMELFEEMDPYVYAIAKKNTKLNPFRDYVGYRKEMGDLDFHLDYVDELPLRFIKTVETTDMSRLYKMPVLLSMFSPEKVTFEPTEEQIRKSFEMFYSRDGNEIDFAKDKKKPTDWNKLAKDNPIHFLCKTHSDFFTINGNSIKLSEELSDYAKSQYFRNEILDAIAYRVIDFKKTRYEDD